MEIEDGRIIVEPLKKKCLKDAFCGIDKEILRKKITFTRKEAIQDDFYD